MGRLVVSCRVGFNSRMVHVRKCRDLVMAGPALSSLYSMQPMAIMGGDG